MIKAIIFDLDDTLVDRNASMRIALSDQYDHFSNKLRCFDKTEYVNNILYLQNHGYVNVKKAYELFFKNRNDQTIIQELCNDINNRYGIKTVLFAGVVDVLNIIKSKYRLSIITNGSIDWQYRKLKQAKIDKYFGNILISEEVGYEKPDKYIFELCLRQQELIPEECIYIGDNPEIDIKPAMGIGMKTIWKDNGYFEKPEKVINIIKHYNELINELYKIENGEI